ncbi:UNVERIFIED_CONTAM: hypothetical protein GTU68_065795 [Idotea baltica]|nr:hypothetical protein [Idotea baltica]
MHKHRFIISGGGSGGHIFPAVAIADELKERFPNAEILFVGAKGKMEMKSVPKAGYRIIGLNVVGLKRSLTWTNLLFPFKLLSSLNEARLIVRDFKPEVVVGVGGYASAPTLAAASMMSVKTLIQEQNSYAGLTNKLLGRRVDKICVAYEMMEKFFPKRKLVLTGNPVRKNLLQVPSKSDALRHFELEEGKQTILIVGGSLGAKTLNEAMRLHVDSIHAQNDVQFIWQIGSYYSTQYLNSETAKLSNVRALTFIDRMDMAYSASDLVLCRAGALTISELCALGKASILIPSPNVAEDHQTSNAMALVSNLAARLVRDEKADEELIGIALELIHEKEILKELRLNILALARTDATERIVDEVLKLVKNL